MEHLAERLESAADALTTVDRSLPVHVASLGAFAADDAGVPGRVGKQLHDRWAAVIAARAREAADTAKGLTDLAADVRLTAKTYAETDDEAARRVRRGI
ncbi:type VII secretion target [Nucisporomicrobium flavum]|uniref:type VII secretion target n=1 Tax=Nucisporomicrobium flavum TaxID=2785915 RepID=UPI0018F52640|nr:type VII secretion target [Nucisporomicrobium flavum]